MAVFLEFPHEHSFSHAIFTTTKIENGSICFFEDHLLRLTRGLKIFDLFLGDFQWLSQRVCHLLKKAITDHNEVLKNSWRLKISLFPKSNYLWESLTNENQLALGLFLSPSHGVVHLDNIHKFHFLPLPTQMNEQLLSDISDIKRENYDFYFQQKRNKKAEIFFYVKNNFNLKKSIVTRLTTSQFFLIKNDIIFFPQYNHKVLESISLYHFHKMIEHSQFKWNKSQLTVEEIENADLVFSINCVTLWIPLFFKNELELNIWQSHFLKLWNNYTEDKIFDISTANLKCE